MASAAVAPGPDTVAPTVASPSINATMVGDVESISVSVSDNVGVTSCELHFCLTRSFKNGHSLF